ncbi:MAG TPA: hypothetical protein VKN37_11135, partial [Roseovarius sp.]|nr:hypothetical protein [Roseovarius sp.]
DARRVNPSLRTIGLSVTKRVGLNDGSEPVRLTRVPRTRSGAVRGIRNRLDNGRAVVGGRAGVTVQIF